MANYQVTPVKWFAAILFKDESILEASLSQLAERLSTIDFRGTPLPFEATDYYRAEMGAGLQRLLVGFSALDTPDRLIDIKIMTAELEREYSPEGNRLINIDPGYLDLYKVVLASCKGRGNKIYLGQGVWADFTLYYQKGAFRTLPWSFPDFRQGLYDSDLKRLRELYKRTLAEIRLAD